MTARAGRADPRPEVLRAQALLRPWGDGGSVERRWRYGTEPPRELDAATALTLLHGVFEGACPAGDEADRLHDATLDPRTGGVTLGAPFDLEDGCERAELEARLAVDRVSSALTQAIWRVGRDPTGVALVGRVLTRPCAIRGVRVRLAVGILGCPASRALPAPLRVEAAGTATREGARYAGTRVVGADARHVPRLGSAADEAFAMPQWGWAREPVGLQCTLRLATAALLDEGRGLATLEGRTPEQDARVAEIDRRTCGILGMGRGDPTYAAFARKVREEPLYRIPTTRPLRAGEILRREEIASRALAGILGGKGP